VTRKRHHGDHRSGQLSQRQLRIGEMLRHALAETLERGELRDPDLAGVTITVTEVRPSPDLRHATAFVMPLGGAHVATIIDALGRAAPFLRRAVAEKVTMRFLPEFRFVADATFEEAGKIDALLRSPSVARDLPSPSGEKSDDGA
jgi:ribosome-binding factor A